MEKQYVKWTSRQRDTARGPNCVESPCIHDQGDPMAVKVSGVRNSATVWSLWQFELRLSFSADLQAFGVYWCLCPRKLHFIWKIAPGMMLGPSKDWTPSDGIQSDCVWSCPLWTGYGFDTIVWCKSNELLGGSDTFVIGCKQLQKEWAYVMKRCPRVLCHWRHSCQCLYCKMLLPHLTPIASWEFSYN